MILIVNLLDERQFINVQDDYRFKDRFSKQNPRKVIHMWAEKELHNLAKMAKGGIRSISGYKMN